jgi:hypothetical protein
VTDRPTLATLPDAALQGLVDEIAPTVPVVALRRGERAAGRTLDEVWAELHRRGWQRRLAPTTDPGVYTLVWHQVPR